MTSKIDTQKLTDTRHKVIAHGCEDIEYLTEVGQMVYYKIKECIYILLYKKLDE